MGFAGEWRETPAVLAAMARRARTGDLRDAVGLAAMAIEATAPSAVLLTGTGSSYFASHYAACLLEVVGRAAVAMDSGELLSCHPAMRAQEGVWVLVSQSGRSGEMLDLLDLRDERAGPCVAVTNEPTSPLGAATETAIPLGVGSEEATSSKTYFATLAALALLADVVGGGTLGIAPGLEEISARFRAAAAAAPSPEAVALADHVANGRNLVFVGKGPGLSSALQGALIMQEAVHAAAVGQTYGQWRHGPSERAGEGVVVVAVPCSAADVEVERTLTESQERGADVVRLPGDGLAPWRMAFDPMLPVYEALLEVGRRTGREVGRLGRKVTGR